MVRSRLVLVLMAVVASLLVPGPASAATSVTIPDGPWAGDVSVQVTSDAPYLRYRIYASGVEVSRLFANQSSGVPQTVTVPTWGLGEYSPSNGAFFEVAGCPNTSPDSCVPAGSKTGTLSQTQAVDITLEAPASPVFVPEQHLFVTADGGTAGAIKLGGVDRYLGSEQVLTDGVRTEVDVTNLVDAKDVTWWVLRCNPVDVNVCGQRPDSQGMDPVSLIRRLTLDVSTAETYVDPDPAAPDATTSMYVRAAPVTQQLSWSLLHSNGQVAVGPVALPSGWGGEFDINPASHASSPLAPGAYTLRVTASASGTAGSRTATDTTPLRVSALPPPDTVALATNSGVVRPGKVQAILRVAQTHVARQDHAIFVVRNRLGQRVWHQTTFDQNTCDTDGDCFHEFSRSWDGRSDAGVLQRPGVYRAYGYLVDKSGQTLKVGLGTVVLQKLVTRTVTTRRLHPLDNDLREPRYDSIGSCSRFRNVTGLVLESMVLPCPSPGSTSDRVWLGIQRGFNEPGLTIDDIKFARLMKVRLHVYGESMRPGSVLTASVQNSLGHNRNTFKRLPGGLTGRVGWRSTGWLTVDPALLGTRHDPAFRLQVGGGSRYHVRYLKASFVYRAWANP